MTAGSHSETVGMSRRKDGSGLSDQAAVAASLGPIRAGGGRIAQVGEDSGNNGALVANNPLTKH